MQNKHILRHTEKPLILFLCFLVESSISPSRSLTGKFTQGQRFHVSVYVMEISLELV